MQPDPTPPPTEPPPKARAPRLTEGTLTLILFAIGLVASAMLVAMIL